MDAYQKLNQTETFKRVPAAGAPTVQQIDP
jgi:hypothetical protein